MDRGMQVLGLSAGLCHGEENPMSLDLRGCPKRWCGKLGYRGPYRSVGTPCRLVCGKGGKGKEGNGRARRAGWAIVEDQQATAMPPSSSGGRVLSERLHLKGVTRAVRNKVGVKKVGSGSYQSGSPDSMRSMQYLKALLSPFFRLRGIWRTLSIANIFGKGEVRFGISKA